MKGYYDLSIRIGSQHLEDLLNIDKPVSIKKTNVTYNYKKK